jgi:hypothetical protein
VTLTNGNNKIYIGDPGAGDESQPICIGTAQAHAYIVGINSTGVSGTAVVVNANGPARYALVGALQDQRDTCTARNFALWMLLSRTVKNSSVMSYLRG